MNIEVRIEEQNQTSVGQLREQITNDVYYLNQLLKGIESLPTPTRSGILSKLTTLQGHLKSTQSDQLEAATSKLDILGIPQSQKRADGSVVGAGQVSTVGMRVDQRSLFNLNTTLRSVRRDEFNWHSIWGNDPNCVQVSEVTIPQAFYKSVRSIPKNPYTCMEHFQACYTGPEVGGRICLLGETASKSNVSMIIMDEKLKQVEAIIESEPINAYMFTFLSNCDIYVNNQGEITIRSPKLLTPYILPIKTVKYYSHQRSNMNRNLLSDLLNVYVIGKTIHKVSKKIGRQEGVFVYPLTMFTDQKSITTTQPLHIPQSEHTVHIALNSKRMYGLKPNGGVFWYHKKKQQMRVNQLHEKFQSMRINVDEKGNPVYDQFKPYYSTIEANEQVVVVAADRQLEHKNIFAILHPVTLVEYDRLEVPHGSTFVAGQVDPIHVMKLFVMQDLCMLIALNRKETIKIFMIHKYKLVLLREVIITTRGMALWGLQFHKPTDEIIVHGNSTVFKKLRITLHKKAEGPEDEQMDDRSLRTEEIDNVDPVAMEKAVAEFKQPIRLKNFQDAVDHFSVKNIADRDH